MTAVAHADRRVAAGIFLLAFATFAFFFGGTGWNQNAQFDLTRSVVERHALNIDPYVDNTSDIATGTSGHTYINKPPGASLLAALPYAAIYFTESLLGISADKNAIMNQRLVTALTCAVCGAAIGAVLFLFGRRRGVDRTPALTAALIVLFGTIVFAYSTMLMAHVPAALFLLLSFTELRERPLVAGVAFGIAVTCFYVCAVALPILALLAFLNARRSLLRFVAGGLPFALLLALYHSICFGSPFRTAVEKSVLFTQKGLLFGVMQAPQLDALWGLTFSPWRGLFFVSPVLLFALVGAAIMYRQCDARRELYAIAAIALGFTLTIASFNGWHGGSAFGPRYLVPIVPLLGVPLMFALASHSRILRAALLGAATISLLTNFIGTATAPMAPAPIRNPLRDYLYPAFFHERMSESARLVFGATTDRAQPVSMETDAQNVGESFFGKGTRMSVLPVVLLMIGGTTFLLRLARRDEDSASNEAERAIAGSEQTLKISRGELAVVAMLTVVGAWLRFRGLGRASLWLDELLNVDIVRHAKPTFLQWLFGFERENGPLYFFLQRFGDHLCASAEVGARLFPALFGIAAIPLAHAVATRARLAPVTRIGFTLLIALSPLHVYYSREGRGYSLLVFAVLAISYALTDIRSRRNALIAALALVAAVYTAATAAPLVIALIVTTIFSALTSTDARRGALRFALGAGVAGVLLVVLYARFPRVETTNTPFDATAGRLFSVLTNGFTVTALESPTSRLAGFLAFLVALFGVGRCAHRPGLQRVLLFGVTSVVAAIGALAFIGHWFSLRYAIAGLPAFLLAFAFGAAELAALVTRGRRFPLIVVASLLIATIALVAVPAALSEPFRKADWRGIAARLAAHARRGDTIIVSTDWANACLRFYLQPERRGLQLLDVNESTSLAKWIAARRERVWLVAGGFHIDGTIRGWMGSDSLLVDYDRLEDIRVYYRPGLADFFGQRATGADIERYNELVRRDAVSLDTGSTSTLVRGGFYGRELAGSTPFRWCDGSCSVDVVLAPTPSYWTARISPSLAAAADSETVVVSVDGVKRDLVLRRGRSDISIPLPARSAARAVSQLTFQFPQAVIPANETTTNNDSRRLAASFERMSQSASASPANATVAVVRFQPHVVRVEENEKAKTKWNDAALAQLLARCGVATSSSRPSFAEVQQAVADAALDTEFRSDEEFLSFVFQLLFSRDADEAALKDYAAKLRSGVPRARLVGWIMRSAEFRARYGSR